MSDDEREGVTRRVFFSQTLIAVPTVSLMAILAAEPVAAEGGRDPSNDDDDDDDD